MKIFPESVWKKDTARPPFFADKAKRIMKLPSDFVLRHCRSGICAAIDALFIIRFSFRASRKAVVGREIKPVVVNGDDFVNIFVPAIDVLYGLDSDLLLRAFIGRNDDADFLVQDTGILREADNDPNVRAARGCPTRTPVAIHELFAKKFNDKPMTPGVQFNRTPLLGPGWSVEPRPFGAESQFELGSRNKEHGSPLEQDVLSLIKRGLIVAYFPELRDV
jgi:hypothetical protein